ncbi:hypothetical protein [Rufibacter latericius]|uniref:hypothetical protein n=1 Tax=Rufibacter latericius TaxID=2487040 RepID=UPI000F62B04E|nr:hypothetical protein [Rufibacter latericius]
MDSGRITHTITHTSLAYSMETRFYLHTKVNKNGEQAIYAEIRSPWLRDPITDRHELRMSTGYSCLAGPTSARKARRWAPSKRTSR